MDFELKKLAVPTLLLSLILGLAWQQQVLAPTVPDSGPPLPVTQDIVKNFSIIAVGDISLSRNIGWAIDKASNQNLPFENVNTILPGADLALGNLECPFTDSNIPLREGLVFRCLPKDAPALATAGFDILTMANNHALDQGYKNITYTKSLLQNLGIMTTGVGENLEEAWTPVTKKINDIKIAVLAASYASHNDGGRSRNDFVARLEDLTKLKTQIAKLKAENNLIIISIHAGIEYTRQPNQDQIDFAHAAIDAGADVVIGHHPHWIQSVEIYPSSPSSPDEGRMPEGQERQQIQHRGLIFYSLGNFVFDQSWSQDTREGLMVKIQISNDKIQTAELIPVIIENNCCPRVANQEEKQSILKKIGLDSDIILLSPPNPLRAEDN